ncbi:hypothetical protein [Paracoccus rhizosphaerae]|uniref:Transglycosylase SLT domain-containing protein n=1 Tax=Paracoccus rhizosphaerae TaxID=1133347 RepID=A0ABV6CQE6_9RHOB|nr:hypothetical protein [Paracoccus rhizosphaerae]
MATTAPLPFPPTRMTVCKIRDWQIAAARQQPSAAIGLLQIVGDTYRSLIDQVNLSFITRFNRRTQPNRAQDPAVVSP